MHRLLGLSDSIRRLVSGRLWFWKPSRDLRKLTQNKAKLPIALVFLVPTGQRDLSIVCGPMDDPALRLLREGFNPGGYARHAQNERLQGILS